MYEAVSPAILTIVVTIHCHVSDQYWSSFAIDLAVNQNNRHCELIQSFVEPVEVFRMYPMLEYFSHHVQLIVTKCV